MGPKLRKAFQKAGGRKFSDSDWLQYIYEGSNKTRFQYCKNSKNVLLYIRAIQGHTGGKVVAPEFVRSRRLFHTIGKNACFTKDVLIVALHFSSQDSLLEEGRADMENNQSSSHLSIRCLRTIQKKNNQETTSRKPRKEHYRSKWKHSQDAVYWVNLARAQDKGLQFWQTRSNAIIVYSSVPSDCIYKVLSQKGNELYSRDSRRLDLHRRLYSKFLGKCSSNNSSSKTLLKVQLPAAGNSLRTNW